MGIFDKMFGGGASAAQEQPDAQKRFNDLKAKYQSVLNIIEQQDVRFVNLYVQDNKLYIKGIVLLEDVKNKVWE